MKNLLWISVICFVHVQISVKQSFAPRTKTKTTIEPQLECAQRRNNHKLQSTSILPISWVSQDNNWIHDTLPDMLGLLRIITMLIITLIVLKKEINMRNILTARYVWSNWHSGAATAQWVSTGWRATPVQSTQPLRKSASSPAARPHELLIFIQGILSLSVITWFSFSTSLMRVSIIWITPEGSTQVQSDLFVLREPQVAGDLCNFGL